MRVVIILMLSMTLLGLPEKPCFEYVCDVSNIKDIKGEIRQGKDVEARIYHGTPANEGERPYQLFILTQEEVLDEVYKHSAGATLIKENWALTVAHTVTKDCTRELHDSVFLVGGSSSLIRKDNANFQGIQFDAKDNVFVHEKWDWSKWNGYDIALIKFPADQRFDMGVGRNIRPIDINKDKSNTDLQGHVITMSGWGRTHDNPEGLVQTLQVASLPLVETPRIFDGHVVSPERVLMASQFTKRSSCLGDSGGPWTLEERGVETLVGIISGGTGKCGDKNEISLAISVYAYREWIQKTIDDN